MTDSILLTVKKMLGISEEYHAFDIDVITNVNAVFLTLNQLGVGPDTPFQIVDENDEWEDFLSKQNEYLAAVQTYVYQRVKLLFDPPTNSFLVDAIQKSCQELEWRFTIQPKSAEQLAYQNSFKTDYESLLVNQNGSEKAETEQVSNATPLKAKKTQPSNIDIFS